MDRTSILGDAIDYMKELLDKINKLQDEEQELGNSNNSHHSKLFGDLKDLNTNEPLVRNSPKVQQRYFHIATLLLFLVFLHISPYIYELLQTKPPVFFFVKTHKAYDDDCVNFAYVVDSLK